ncbi:hypothetical protein HOY82DRAFT_537294 [Tuber indicum]|nr:hypothetical protein HOY82DRAFT_537294 [Tuber indicum]
MSDNYKHQSPGGCGQFSAQPEFNYSIENRPQLNFDGYQGQSHGFIQKDFLSYTLNPNSVPCNTQRADYPSQNTHDFQLSVQTRPLYQQQFPQIKLPNRERSCTLPGSKNTQPTVFEGYCKASWNRPQVYDSGGVGIPSSEGDPYAGVRKWNELNSQRFLHKNSNNPPPPKIPSTDEKSILFGPRYARARMLEAHQKTSPPTLQHPPNPRHLLSDSHNRSQRFLEGEGKAERRFRGQCDSVHMMGGLAASESARIRIFDPTVSNSTPSGPRSRVSAESPISRVGSSGSGTSDEYMGFIIPSDPYTFYPVQESSKKLQNSGADPAKTEATGHSGMAVKDQSIAPICQQPAPGVNTPNSETGSLLGPAQNPMGRDGDGDSGANDEYMGFIIPSDPYTFHPVQESSKRVRNSEVDPTKTEATDHSGMTMKDQVIALICQQPGPKVNKSNSKTGSLLGPAENPTGGDGGSNSGANDEYIGFIIPSDPYTLHAVQNSNTKFWKLGTDHGRVRIAEDGGKAQFRITAPVQQPALKVNSPNLKTATQQADAREDQVHSLPSRKIV